MVSTLAYSILNDVSIFLYTEVSSVFSFYVMFLLINPIILLPFEAAIPHCSETFISALISIPKSFSITVIPRTVSPIFNLISKFPCPVCRHLHFPKFNNVCYFSDHLTNLSRSFCTCCLSPSVYHLSKHICVVCKFQYVACYTVVQVIDIY